MLFSPSGKETGLLEGLDNDTKKNGMARLLENQAKELLREAASTMAGGDVQGFASCSIPYRSSCIRWTHC